MIEETRRSTVLALLFVAISAAALAAEAAIMISVIGIRGHLDDRTTQVFLGGVIPAAAALAFGSFKRRVSFSGALGGVVTAALVVVAIALFGRSSPPIACFILITGPFVVGAIGAGTP